MESDVPMSAFYSDQLARSRTAADSSPFGTMNRYSVKGTFQGATVFLTGEW
jgi:hypothetical protein